jgi:hypothetical protein
MIIFLIIFFSINTYSQEYTTTNFKNDPQEVFDLFDSLWDDYKWYDQSHCYRKAHLISYEMSKKDIVSSKVFLFIGDGDTFGDGWWYHVAAFVNFKNRPVVMDKGLIPAPLFLEDWMRSLTKTKSCEKINSFKEYKELKSKYKCMYLITNMYQYYPSDLDSLNKNSFSGSDLEDMLFVIPKRKRRKFKNKTSLFL